jgi:hypothetical protein
MSPSRVPRVKSGRPAVFQQAVLDELILDGAVGAHLAARRVAAVEAHEGVRQLIVELAGDVLFVHVLRGTELLMSSSVTASPVTQAPMYSLRAP